MAHRDPETGRFLPGHRDEFQDYEVVSFDANAGIAAANLTGSTGFTGGADSQTFAGGQLIDYDEVVDRNESLVLLEAYHEIVVYINSTSTADGTVRGTAEISASPTNTFPFALGTVADVYGGGITEDTVGRIERDDSIDILGRLLRAVGHGPITDGATGVGGGGAAGRDAVHLQHPVGHLAEFHPRDELFLNGRFDVWNVDDAAVHLDLVGQHTYGVVTE